MKVPLFSAREDFKSVLAKMGLQARGCGGVDSDSVGGTWDISNADRIKGQKLSNIYDTNLNIFNGQNFILKNPSNYIIKN